MKTLSLSCLDDRNDLGTCAMSPIASMRTHASALDEYLRTLGFTYVRAEYVGQDGHGRFIAVRCYGSDCDDAWTVAGQVRSKFLAFFTSILEARCGNWRDGDGSCGDFLWDLAANTLRHTHYLRCEHPKPTVLLGIEDISSSVRLLSGDAS